MNREVDILNQKEIDTVKRSTLYELRLSISQNPKEEYTKEELLNLIDTIAIAKEQE